MYWVALKSILWPKSEIEGKSTETSIQSYLQYCVHKKLSWNVTIPSKIRGFDGQLLSVQAQIMRTDISKNLN